MRRTTLSALAAGVLVTGVAVGGAAARAEQRPTTAVTTTTTATTAGSTGSTRTASRAALPVAEPIGAVPTAPTRGAALAAALPTLPAKAGAARTATLAASAEQARAMKAMDAPSVPGQSDPVEDPYYPQYSQPELDALHYWLDLRWDGSTLAGFTTVDLRATTDTDTLHLALGSPLRISNAWLDGRPVGVSQSGELATFATGRLTKDQVARLQVQYSGSPRCVPGPSPRQDLQCQGWNQQGGRVWTLQEPYGAFTWYPSSDHPSDKAMFDARITTTNGTVGVFNGVPMTQWDSTSGSTVVRNYHLDSPTATYLTTLAIGDYRSSTTQLSDGKQWTVWYTPAEANVVPQIQSEARRAYDFMQQRAGRYPFGSIGNVMVPAFSAMETQTMITMGTREINPVLMHELGHHWFGDRVTTKTWKDMWLNEGWTMYMQGLYQNTPVSTFQQQCRASVPADGQAGSPGRNRFGQNNVYVCPAVALDQIRRDLGAARFDELAAAWPAEHADQSVDRAEFERWLNAKTGKDYSPLLAQWLDNVR